MTPEIIPTVVPQAFDDILAARKRYAFAPSLHIDVCDGVFAQGKTWIPAGEKLLDTATVTYEAHLMLEQPLSVGVSFARAGVRRVIAHVESFENADSARDAFALWRSAGVSEIGLAALMTTPLSELVPYLRLCDFVHLMTIANIGKQGFPFDPASIPRVRDFHTRNAQMRISVDGGETEENVDDLAEAGASRFCIGSVLAKAKDPEKEYSRLLATAQSIL